MKTQMGRRDFLRASSAVGAHALASRGLAASLAAQSPRMKAVAIASTPYTPGPGYPIRAKHFSQVTLRDRFWKPRIATNASVTIPLLVQRQMEGGGGRGINGNLLEAAILSLQTHPDSKLQAMVEARVEQLLAQPRPGNGGFEAAATYYHATGRRDLVDAAVKAADALYEDYKINNPPFSGGERDAVNCLQLYGVTRDKKHLDLAKHYLDIRGLENSVNRSRHNQSYLPVLEQREAVGHAVNCVTLLVSLLDVGTFTGLSEYAEAARRMWLDIVSRKMYITGGVGSTGNEGFGEPYSLPNISAYAETCAVLMFATLNHKLFLSSGDGKYVDVLERGIYNNALSGVSLSGDRFFYVNRLASAGDGRDSRWERASLECCPPNLVRFLASMPGYIYAQDPKGVLYVNLYVSSDAQFDMRGNQIGLSVDSEMPWGGRSTIKISAKQPVKGTIKLRIPGWARNNPAPGGLYSYLDNAERSTALSINGNGVSAAVDTHGYVTLDREWRDGDLVDVQFPFAVRKVGADSRIRETRGRIAVERGPIVYCAEWPETDDRRALGLVCERSADLKAEADAGLLGGVTVIRTVARKITDPSSSLRPITLTPYNTWANRGPGEMTVWLATRDYAVGDTGPAGGLIFFVNPNHAADGWRYLEAAPVDQSGGARWGCFRTAINGARGKAVGTGRQNTADILAACSEPGTAADLCASYVLNGVDGWFLPSTDELAMMYRNLKVTGASDFRDHQMVDNCQYWTSSQQTADMADHIDFTDNGRLHYDDKDFPRRVRAIRAF
jgi:DUF1680 family protein